MKTGNALLILAAVILSCFVWWQYSAHKAAEKAAHQKAIEENFRRYERCTEPIFAEYPADKTAPDYEAAVQRSNEAIKGCREFLAREVGR